MVSLEDQIRKMIKERYGGVPRFAKEIGVSASSIYTVLNNGISGGSTSTVLPIIAGLGLDANWIVKNKLIKTGDSDNDFVDVKVYGHIAAGTPIEMTECDYEFPCPRKIKEKHPNSGWLIVDGNSWNKGGLPNGILALVDFDLTEPVNSSEPYAVCVNGHSATIKAFEKLANGCRLIPNSYDPTYIPIIFDYNKDDTEEVTIIGKVVYAAYPYDWQF